MKTSPIKAILLGAVLTAGMVMPVCAGSFGINPVADAFVTTGASGNLSNTNYGGAGVLGVAASGKSQGEFQSVLRFDLSDTRNALDAQYGVGQWSVQSLTLQLTAASNNNGILNAPSAGQFGISLMQNNSWTEGSGTPTAPGTTGMNWNSLQSTYINNATDENLGSFSFGGGASGANVYTLTLSPTLAADLFSGSELSLRLFAEDSNVSYLFNSRNFGTAGNRPVLTITAVPEPGIFSFSVLALTSLAGWQFAIRRKRG